MPYNAKWRAMVKAIVAHRTSVDTAPATPRARSVRVRCLVMICSMLGMAMAGRRRWFQPRRANRERGLFPQQLAQRRRRLGAADVVDLARQAERSRSELFDLPALGVLSLELTEPLVQIVQSGLQLFDAGGPIHHPDSLRTHRRSPARLTGCERGSWPQWEFLLSGFRRTGTVADRQREFLRINLGATGANRRRRIRPRAAAPSIAFRGGFRESRCSPGYCRAGPAGSALPWGRRGFGDRRFRPSVLPPECRRRSFACANADRRSMRGAVSAWSLRNGTSGA